MGTCYRLFDHKNKLYFDMDKWAVPYQVTDAASLNDYLSLQGASWMREMMVAVLNDIALYMEYPLEGLSDCAHDQYHDLVDDDEYLCCGTRFTAYWGVRAPRTNPDIQGTYLTWDTEPFTASMPPPAPRLWNGYAWMSADRGLPISTELWWADPAGRYVTEFK